VGSGPILPRAYRPHKGIFFFARGGSSSPDTEWSPRDRGPARRRGELPRTHLLLNTTRNVPAAASGRDAHARDVQAGPCTLLARQQSAPPKDRWPWLRGLCSDRRNAMRTGRGDGRPLRAAERRLRVGLAKTSEIGTFSGRGRRAAPAWQGPGSRSGHRTRGRRGVRDFAARYLLLDDRREGTRGEGVASAQRDDQRSARGRAHRRVTTGACDPSRLPHGDFGPRECPRKRRDRGRGRRSTTATSSPRTWRPGVLHQGLFDHYDAPTWQAWSSSKACRQAGGLWDRGRAELGRSGRRTVGLAIRVPMAKGLHAVG